MYLGHSISNFFPNNTFIDKRRFGRLIAATKDENISKIQAFIQGDKYCTFDEIEARVSDLSKDYTQYNTKLFEAKKSFIEQGKSLHMQAKFTSNK